MNARKRSDQQWSSLPNELLKMIGERLDTRIDVLRFRAVCTSWRSSIVSPSRSKISPLFPMKLPYPIVPKPIGDKHLVHFTLTESTLYRFELPPPPDHHHHQDKNSSNYSGGGGGWLVKVEEESSKPGKLCLLNPLSHDTIRYNSKTFPKKLNLLNYRVFELGKAYNLEYVNDYCRAGVDKAIFSAEHSAVIAIYDGGRLALWRLGDEKWTQLGETWHTYYRDIMLYKGKFHAIDSWGKLVVIDSSTLKITEGSRPLYNTGTQKHLLQSSGDLYVVDRYLDRDRRVMYYDENLEEYYYKDKNYHCVGKTVDFEIYKLNEVDRDWVKVKTFVDQVMFLGDDCSLFCSVEELVGCRGNCIYFNDKDGFYYHSKKDDVLKGLHGHATALFNLDDRSISGLASGPGNFQAIWPPPTWLKSD